MSNEIGHSQYGGIHTGFSQWGGNLLARETGNSKYAIWLFLNSQCICLARKRTWCVSTDPAFAAKAADAMGLYLAPPENALMISVDEKPNIQVLQREFGYVTISDKKLIQKLESTCKRNGTLNLFAALEVSTAQIHAMTTEPEQKTPRTKHQKRFSQIYGWTSGRFTLI